MHLVKSVLKALDILEALGQKRGSSVSELARATRIPRGTTYRLLNTMATRGYVIRDVRNRGLFYMGPQLAALASKVLDRADLTNIARHSLEVLNQQTNETVHFVIKHGDEVLYIDKIETSRAVRMHSYIGMRGHMHSTAVGKAIMAFLPEDEVDRVAARSRLPPQTPKTITDLEHLKDHLAAVRQLGYAIDDVENEEGIRCVAAPVFDHQGEPIGAISVSGPAYRLSVDTLVELAPLVLSATQEVSCRLGYTQAIKDSSLTNCING